MISILGIVIGALGMAAGFAGLGNNGTLTCLTPFPSADYSNHVDKTASAIQIVLYVFFILISLLGCVPPLRRRTLRSKSW